MNTIANGLKSFWNWLDGKKTILAELYWFISGTIVLIWVPSGLTGTPLKIQLSIGAFLTFLGLGHKMLKGSPGKNINITE